MTFEEALVKYSNVIDQEIQAFKREHKNWRLEFDDLKQECLLDLWKGRKTWLKAQNMLAYCRSSVRHCLGRYEQQHSKDALHHANNYGLNPGTALEIEAR